MRALEMGAFDFITKPDGVDAEASRAVIDRELTSRARVLCQERAIRGILAGQPAKEPGVPISRAAEAVLRPPPVTEATNLELPGERSAKPARLATGQRPELALIGLSTGGPVALTHLLPKLPANLGIPVLVVQHMPPIFTASLAESLAAKCVLRIKEATHLEVAQPNCVYIAPGGRQMRIARRSDGEKRIEITDDPPENNCKPAVDYLFRSAATHFPGRSVAAILTGMGSDGTIGLRLLKRHHCFVIAQDQPTSVVFGMPKAAIDAGVVDTVLPLDSIAACLVSAIWGTSL
jgi:two-component system chemotaxis response regulator CheB